MVRIVKIGRKEFTEAEFEQAQKLIFAGKAGAARGDPRLQSLINLLSERGFTAAERQLSSDVVFVDGQGFSVAPEKREAFARQQIDVIERQEAEQVQRDVVTIGGQGFSVRQEQQSPFIQEEFSRIASQPTTRGLITSTQLDTGIIPTGTIIQESPGLSREALGPSIQTTSDIGGLSFFQELGAREETQRFRGDAGFGEFFGDIRRTKAGVGRSLEFGFEAGKEILGSPEQVVLGPVVGVGVILADPVGVLGQVRTKVAQDPFFSAGFVAGEAAQALVFGEALRVPGRIRRLQTFRGLEEIPFESLTVSERFAQAPLGTTAQELAEQFKQQRIVTRGGVDKQILLPGEVISDEGVRVFTASASGPRGKEFAAFLGKSREPGPFFSPQLSKEFLGRDVSKRTFFGLDDLGLRKEPVAFRTTLKEVTRTPEELLSGVRQKGTEGFKGFATPEQQAIIKFRTEVLDPETAAISTRFELIGGEIEAIGRPGGVFEQIRKPRFFTTTPQGRKVLIEEIRPTGRVVEPEDLIKRPRGTAIVRTEKGILLTFAPEERAFVLPGGGVDPGEIPLQATLRELREETGLVSKGGRFIGEVEGPIKRFGAKRPFSFVKEEFKVFEVEAKGIPRPRGEISKIAFFKPDSKLPISPTTKEILDLAGFEDFSKPGKALKGARPTRIKPPKQIDQPKTFTSREILEISEEQFKPLKKPIITPSRVLPSLSKIDIPFKPLRFEKVSVTPRRGEQGLVFPKTPISLLPISPKDFPIGGSSFIREPTPKKPPGVPLFLVPIEDLTPSITKRSFIPRGGIDFGFEEPFKPVRQERKFKRVPSFAALTLPSLGLPTSPKVSKALEQTGLSERVVIKKIKLPNLGPFKL